MCGVPAASCRVFGRAKRERGSRSTPAAVRFSFLKLLCPLYAFVQDIHDAFRQRMRNRTESFASAHQSPMRRVYARPAPGEHPRKDIHEGRSHARLIPKDSEGLLMTRNHVRGRGAFAAMAEMSAHVPWTGPAAAQCCSEKMKASAEQPLPLSLEPV